MKTPEVQHPNESSDRKIKMSNDTIDISDTTTSEHDAISALRWIHRAIESRKTVILIVREDDNRKSTLAFVDGAKLIGDKDAPSLQLQLSGVLNHSDLSRSVIVATDGATVESLQARHKKSWLAGSSTEIKN